MKETLVGKFSACVNFIEVNELRIKSFCSFAVLLSINLAFWETFKWSFRAPEKRALCIMHLNCEYIYSGPRSDTMAKYVLISGFEFYARKFVWSGGWVYSNMTPSICIDETRRYRWDVFITSNSYYKDTY